MRGVVFPSVTSSANRGSPARTVRPLHQIEGLAGSLALVLREVEEEVVAADPKVFPVA
jgi:hypothetical protein